MAENGQMLPFVHCPAPGQTGLSVWRPIRSLPRHPCSLSRQFYTPAPRVAFRQLGIAGRRWALWTLKCCELRFPDAGMTPQGTQRACTSGRTSDCSWGGAARRRHRCTGLSLSPLDADSPCTVTAPGCAAHRSHRTYPALSFPRPPAPGGQPIASMLGDQAPRRTCAWAAALSISALLHVMTLTLLASQSRQLTQLGRVMRQLEVSAPFCLD